jgi:hypothetical protein
MSDYQRLRTPFTAMSFTPDVPSNALGPNEYNSGKNVEADVRGIKKIAGELEVLSSIDEGLPIFMEGGFRGPDEWVYIVATRNFSSEGKWFMITASGITNITPGIGGDPAAYIPGYTDDTNITASWVGNVFFINDGIGAPMYFLPTANEIYRYDAAPDNYVWNYETGFVPSITSVTAGFMRNFCSPNVGNILIAGNLTKTDSSFVETNYPTTIRWSQAFASTGVPATWEPTLSNIANEQEVPVRGPLVDGFFLGGNFYVCSYWDTVVLSPIAYQNSTTPVFGVRLFNQGRGLFNNNCWTNTDSSVYGIDSRDIWVFDGANFNSLGNQRVKEWFFGNLSPTYAHQMFMVNNTQKNQIEIYFPDLDSSGWCNKMLSYRYDLQLWNAPKDISYAVMGTEGPRYDSATSSFNLASRNVVYVRNIPASKIVETGIGTANYNGDPIDAEFERTNITLQTQDGPVPYGSKVYAHRVLPEISGTGSINVTVGYANSTAQTPVYGETTTTEIDTETPWVTTQQNTGRTLAVKFGTNDATDTWNVTALNWQATVTEDAF